MANPQYFDRRKQVSYATGTGVLALQSPTGPWKALNTVGGTLTIGYCIAHQTGADWEVGLGSVDSSSQNLTRLTVFDGSAGAGNFVNFSTGTKDVFITPNAAHMVRVNPWTCNGRLGLSSGSPAAEVSSSSTIYFTPYQGNQIAIPEPQLLGAGQWKLWDFTELSLTLSGLTLGVPYDVFIVDNGVPVLNYTQWTNNSTRSNPINYLDGIPMVGPVSNGWRYLGTFYPASATTTADYAKQRFLWNYYNQLPRRLANFPVTGNWTGVGALAWRGQNNDATKARAVEFVNGLNPPWRNINVRLSGYANCPSGTYAQLAIALDTTSSPNWTDTAVAEFSGQGASGAANYIFTEYNQLPAIGYHYLQPIEAIQVGTGTVTFFDYVANRFLGGIQGTYWN